MCDRHTQIIGVIPKTKTLFNKNHGAENDENSPTLKYLADDHLWLQIMLTSVAHSPLTDDVHLNHI